MTDPATAVLHRLSADPNLSPDFARILREKCFVCRGCGVIQFHAVFGVPVERAEPQKCAWCNGRGYIIEEQS